MSACALMPTWKQPSPSTKPTTQWESRFMTNPERQVSEGSRRCSDSSRAFPADCPRVGRLLTAGPRADEYRSVFEDFPAYGSVCLRLAFPNLRSVIVTAVVYRGFSSELCLAANPSL